MILFVFSCLVAGFFMNLASHIHSIAMFDQNAKAVITLNIVAIIIYALAMFLIGITIP